jgi:dienelactone hydrolase
MMIKPLLDTDKKTCGLNAWKQQRIDILTRLFETIGTPPVKRNTRDIKITSTDQQTNYARLKLNYRVGEGEKITAYLLIPDQLKQKGPAILALHQTVDSGKYEVVGLDGQPDYAYGHELAERGYIVLAPDYLTAGERIFAQKAAFDSEPFYIQYPNWSMVGKNVEDTKAAVDVLYSLDCVDRDRIGVIGHSHGGHNAIFAAALDERIKVVASNCGFSVFTEEEERLEWSLEDGYIYIPKLRQYFLENRDPPFDLHEVAALIAPKPWLNISAYEDDAFGNQEFLAEVGTLLYQIYKLHNTPEAFAYYMHGNNHSFPDSARALAYGWLDRHLLKSSTISNGS